MRVASRLALAISLLVGAAACTNDPMTVANNAAQANMISNAVNTAETKANQAGAATRDLDGARALLERVYARFRPGAQGVPDNPFTPELVAAIRNNSEMEGGGLDFDPFCQCQDSANFSHRIETMEPTPEGARARVSIRNMGEARIIPIRLVQRNGNWLVADVGEGTESLLNAR